MKTMSAMFERWQVTAGGYSPPDPSDSSPPQKHQEVSL